MCCRKSRFDSAAPAPPSTSLRGGRVAGVPEERREVEGGKEVKAAAVVVVQPRKREPSPPPPVSREDKMREMVRG